MTPMTCNGFTASGISSGLKKKQARDLGLIYSKVPAKSAGVFTRNRVQAAPVMLDRQRIQSGVSRAIIVNSGNANCCTGEKGFNDARSMAASVAAEMGIPEDQVLVASTGVIGCPLPIDRIRSAVPHLVQSLRPEGFHDLAAAIMTTDTVPKMVSRQGVLDGRPYTLLGVAKGAGMIRPDMATMLCFVCSDVDADHHLLHALLQTSSDRSFNRITIDGDTSTNDTVLILANGLSGAVIRTDAHQAMFQQLLDDALTDLARQIVTDAEGATKLVEIAVRNARTPQDARRIADTVANSNLVKTAFFGEDANWGRILAAAGRAGIELDPDRLDIFFDEVLMVQGGRGCGPDAEARATGVLKKAAFTVTIDVHLGTASCSVVTCDFSIDYVKINADYRS